MPIGYRHLIRDAVHLAPDEPVDLDTAMCLAELRPRDTCFVRAAYCTLKPDKWFVGFNDNIIDALGSTIPYARYRFLSRELRRSP